MRRSGCEIKSGLWLGDVALGSLAFDTPYMDAPMRVAQRLLAKPLGKFLQWVFGPKGIRSLRLFAYGDFSHGRRYEERTLLFRRREEVKNVPDYGMVVYFDELRRGEDPGLWELWELFERESFVLRANPTDSLFSDMVDEDE